MLPRAPDGVAEVGQGDGWRRLLLGRFLVDRRRARRDADQGDAEPWRVASLRPRIPPHMESVAGGGGRVHRQRAVDPTRATAFNASRHEWVRLAVRTQILIGEHLALSRRQFPLLALSRELGEYSM